MTLIPVAGGAAEGIALINSIGGPAGFIGPCLRGWTKDATVGSLDTGMKLIAGFLVLESLLVLKAIPRPGFH